MRRISRADLLGTFPIFLLEVYWNSQVYRFSSKPINLQKANGESVQFIGGLEDPELTEALSTLDKDPEKNTLPVELCFDIDLVEQFFKYGRSLDGAKAYLDMVTERDATILQTYEDRTRLFSGKVIQPIIGDPEKPQGYCTFTVERNPNNEPSPIIQPSGIYQGQASIVSSKTVVESSSGKAYPIVIGQPQNVLANTGININYKNVYGTKAFMIYRVSSGASSPAAIYDKFWLCIAGHPVQATTVTIKDYQNNIKTGVPVKETTTLQGVTISYVELQFAQKPSTVPSIVDGIVNPFQKSESLLGTESALTDKPEYYVSWSGGGGLIGPTGDGFLHGAGDIITYFLELSNVDIDVNAWKNAASFLNAYKIGGYIDDPETTPFAWLQDSIFPFVPVKAVNGANGMRPVIPLLYMQQIPQSIYSVELGTGFYLVSPVQWSSEPDELINRILLRYAYDASRESNQGQIIIDGNQTSNDFDRLSNQTSQLSYSKYGDRYEEIEFDFCYDFQTANRAAQYYIESNALPKIEMEIEADTQFGWLQLGDILSLNSTGYFFNELKTQIIEKKWNGGSWLFTVEFDNNVSKNQR